MRFRRPRIAGVSLVVAGAVTAGQLAGPAPAAPQRALSRATVTVTCRGTEHLCTAVVSIAGGASNRAIAIKLPGTSWKAPTITVSPKASRGAYSLSHRRFAVGASEYLFTLNAVRANPHGAHLTLTFRQKT